MKKSFLLFLFFMGILASIRAQSDAPVVEYAQGKIIGDLPYGRHFFIEGNTSLQNGAKADRVSVRIYKTGRETFRRRKTLPLLSDAAIQKVTSDPKNLINSSDWDAYRAENLESFKAYINTTLQFQKEYLVEFTYYRVFNFTLTNEERDAILQVVVDRASSYFNDKGEITDVVVASILEEEVTNVLRKKVNEGDDVFFNPQRIKENLPVIDRSALQALSDIIPDIAASKQIISSNEAAIQKKQAEIDALPEDSPDIASGQKFIANKKQQNAREQVNLDKSTGLGDKLQVIKSQMVIANKEYSISSSNASSIPEINAIRVGTSFGGGALGLNVLNKNSREFDSFGYTALKFYLLPVDKRIAEPYMSDKVIINRLSVLIGFSTKKDLSYKGIKLDQAFSVTPLLGLSYDVSRFFSLDLVMTFFKQPSISPLIEKKNLRVGPVLGINLDIDMFNRVSGLVSGDQYRINPSN